MYELLYFPFQLPSEWSRYLGLNKAALVAARLKAGPTKFKVESRDVSPTVSIELLLIPFHIYNS